MEVLLLWLRGFSLNGSFLVVFNTHSILACFIPVGYLYTSILVVVNSSRIALYTVSIRGIVRSVVLSIFKTLVLMFTSLGGDAIGSLLLCLLVVLSPAGIAQ